MFATLIGTNTGGTEHQEVFYRLHAIAIERGFIPSNTAVQIQPDGPLDDWSLEQKGPPDLRAEFFLAVTAPRVPGISPIFPVFQTIAGPLFAVVVLDSVFVVSREDHRDVSEVQDLAAVLTSFESFLEWLPLPVSSDSRGIGGDKIPTLAFIEAQVIHQAVAKGALTDSVRAVETYYNLAEGSLGNGVFLESRMLTLLYCLVVVPKEVWASESEHPVYQAVSTKWRIPQGAVSNHRSGFPDRPTYQFIHHLRNAVAHARFSFRDQRFHFWDQRRHEHEPSFRASVSLSELQEFLEIVGAAFANLRSDSTAQQGAN